MSDLKDFKIYFIETSNKATNFLTAAITIYIESAIAMNRDELFITYSDENSFLDKLEFDVFRAFLRLS